MVLENLGLSTDAEDIYRALLEHSDWGVRELAGEFHFSDLRVRRALDRLSELMLIRESHQHPGAFRAIRPEVGLSRLLARQQAELVRRQQEAARTHVAVADMIARFHDLRPGLVLHGSEKVEGLDRVMDRLEVLAKSVRHELLAFVPGGAQVPQALAAARRNDTDLLARGVEMRTIYQDSARNDPLTLAYAEWLAQSGGEVRTLPVLPPRMLVFDRATAVVPLDPQDSRAGALVTSEPGIVSALVALFEQTWQNARPIGASRERHVDGLLASERAVLNLLAQGLTDEAAAKRLGVSPRTVRRTVAALMDRLDARSRFEAGLRAAQLGWL